MLFNFGDTCFVISGIVVKIVDNNFEIFVNFVELFADLVKLCINLVKSFIYFIELVIDRFDFFPDLFLDFS